MQVFKFVGSLNGPFRLAASAMSHNGYFFITSHTSGLLIVWDLIDLHLEFRQSVIKVINIPEKGRGIDNKVTCIAISPDDLTAAVSSSTGSVRLWSLSTGACLRYKVFVLFVCSMLTRCLELQGWVRWVCSLLNGHPDLFAHLRFRCDWTS